MPQRLERGDRKNITSVLSNKRFGEPVRPTTEQPFFSDIQPLTDSQLASFMNLVFAALGADTFYDDVTELATKVAGVALTVGVHQPRGQGERQEPVIALGPKSMIRHMKSRNIRSEFDDNQIVVRFPLTQPRLKDKSYHHAKVWFHIFGRVNCVDELSENEKGHFIGSAEDYRLTKGGTLEQLTSFPTDESPKFTVLFLRMYPNQESQVSAINFYSPRAQSPRPSPKSSA